MRIVLLSALLVGGCVSIQDKVAAYGDERLCAELKVGSAHSKQLYRTEASRRSLVCGAPNPGDTRGGARDADDG